MAIVAFPDVTDADEDGLLAFGGDLDPASLYLAYSQGIFPWPQDDQTPLLWFSPNPRAILHFDDFKIPTRLRRYLRKSSFTFQINTACYDVIDACARGSQRKTSRDTWITKSMQQAYKNWHDLGYVVSFETWNQHNQLVGGLYGVKINRMFAGESMFFLEDHASKFALIKAVHYLKNLGVTWMDIQQLTPLLESFGAKHLERATFLDMLQHAIQS